MSPGGCTGFDFEKGKGVTSFFHTYTVANCCWVGIGAGTRAARKAASAGASGCSRYVSVGVGETMD